MLVGLGQEARPYPLLVLLMRSRFWPSSADARVQRRWRRPVVLMGDASGRNRATLLGPWAWFALRHLPRAGASPGLAEIADDQGAEFCAAPSSQSWCRALPAVSRDDCRANPRLERRLARVEAVDAAAARFNVLSRECGDDRFDGRGHSHASDRKARCAAGMRGKRLERQTGQRCSCWLGPPLLSALISAYFVPVFLVRTLAGTLVPAYLAIAGAVARTPSPRERLVLTIAICVTLVPSTFEAALSACIRAMGPGRFLPRAKRRAGRSGLALSLGQRASARSTLAPRSRRPFATFRRRFQLLV